MHASAGQTPELPRNSNVSATHTGPV